MRVLEQIPDRSTRVEITTVASNYHIEMNPSDAGNNDRLVVQEVLKEIAQYHLADANSKRQFKGMSFSWKHSRATLAH